MSQLTVINPLEITPAMLVSTNVPEADHAEWVVGTTYAIGNRVIRASVHKVYESLANSNTGNAPESSPTHWIEVGATNRWSMFDGSVSRSTAQSGTISLTLRPGTACDALAAINLVGCTSIRVRVQDATYGTLYDVTTDLSAVPQAPDWWSWFLGPRSRKTQVISSGIPGLMTADVLVDFAGGADLAVGVLLVGVAQPIGIGPRLGAKLGISDYSRKETNVFGDTALVQRAFARSAEFDMLVPRATVDSVIALLAGVRARPVLWIGSDSYESTVVFGFYKDFSVLISYPDYAVCTLNIEGLT